MTSGQSQLDYIAHSQGTLMAFAGFSSSPTLSQRVRTFYALAPVWSLNHITSPLKDLAKPYLVEAIQVLFYSAHDYEYGTSDSLDEKLSTYFCETMMKWDQAVCSNVINWFEGFDAKYTNNSRVPVYLTHTPAGTSVKNLVHFAQILMSGKNARYDYGSAAKNQQAYGQPTPPLYNVQNLQVPTVLFSGGEDSLADPTDVNSTLIPLIQSKVVAHIYRYDFNHLDFTYGLGAYQYIYPPMLDLMNQRR